MSRLVSTSVSKCANLTCPNRVGEGAWEIVATDEPVVGGHRPLMLSMCGPCATAFRVLTGQPTVGPRA